MLLNSKFRYTIPFLSYFIKSENKYGFEKLFKSYSNMYFHNYARTGLRLLLSSIGKSGLNVAVQAYTCDSVFKAIQDSGHKIIFLDINDSFKMDIDDLKRKKSKIDVLIITHTFGIPSIYEINNILSNNVIVIEDCCHSIFTKFNEKFTGNFYDASIFSLGFGKSLPIGNGGFTVINNTDKFKKFNSLHNKLSYEPIFKLFFLIIKSIVITVLTKPKIYSITYKYLKYFDRKVDVIGKKSSYESKGIRLTKTICESNLKLFKSFSELNKFNFKLVISKINKSLVSKILYDTQNSNCYLFPLLVNKRDDFYDYMLNNGFECGKHFSMSLINAKGYGYESGDCPKTEEIVKNIITLPIHSKISKSRILNMINIINNYNF